MCLSMPEDSGGVLKAAALDIELSAEERTYIEEPYEPRSIVGHASQMKTAAHTSPVMCEQLCHL